MTKVAKLLMFLCAASFVIMLLCAIEVDFRNMFGQDVYVASRTLKSEGQSPSLLEQQYSNGSGLNVVQLPEYFEIYKYFLHQKPIERQNWSDNINNDDQQQVVDKFCARHGMQDMAYHIPSQGWEERGSFFRHILYDDTTELIFAYLPKVASSHIRRFVCVLSRIFPVGTVFSRTVSVKKMELCVHNSTFLNRNLQDPDRVQRLRKYWKVAILRNPLERLVSAYRDKIVGKKRKPHEKEWAIEIMNMYNVSEVDFETYIQWIVDKHNKKLNEHFAPLYLLTNPCTVRYNYYGNFKRLSEEMAVISKRLKVHRRLFADFDYHAPANRTENLVDDYFSTISHNLKIHLFWDFYLEFDFYFSLFPEELGSIQILNLNKI